MAASQKKCSRCGEMRALDEFYADKRASDGRESRCKPCEKEYHADRYIKNKPAIAERNRKWSKANPERRLNISLRHKFGIGLDEYNRMLAAQDGVCAICGKVDKFGRKLAVDHDHATGRIRQLLCIPCNVALGGVNDDVHVLRSAIAYLERHGK